MTDDPDALEAVFWDIGGVIVDLDSIGVAQRAFVAELVERHALDATTADALDTWETAVGRYLRERDGTEFRPAREAYARGVEALLDERLAEEAWRPLLRDAVADARKPEPGAVETIAELADADLHLGVVSDVDHEEGHHILEQLGVREHFDAVTTSEAVGRTKPDPAMFETALSKAGVEPERALMVGDRYEHDVAGAKEAGIRTAAYGADDGPAVDYRIDDLRELLDIVGVDSG